MRTLFNDLLATEGVKGALFFAPSGELRFAEFNLGGNLPGSGSDWFALVTSLGKTREADLTFEKGRLYIRRVAEGVLVVVMGAIAPDAMVRLHCDVLLPNLREHRNTKGIKRFFNR
jgi:hypothetical protein